MTKSTTKLDTKQELVSIQTIENEQSLALKAATLAQADFKESSKLKNHARALISAAIFTKFKQSSHNITLANNLLNAQKDKLHADVMQYSIKLCVLLGWINPDSRNEEETLDSQYKQLDKDNKGLLQAMRDCNKFALAAWKHAPDSLMIIAHGNRLTVRVREDFYIENDALTSTDTRTIGNAIGSIPFEKVLRQAKSDLGLTNTEGREGNSGQGKKTDNKEITMEQAISFINSVIDTGNAALGSDMLTRLDNLSVKLFNYVQIERDLEKQKNPREKKAA